MRHILHVEWLLILYSVQNCIENVRWTTCRFLLSSGYFCLDFCSNHTRIHCSATGVPVRGAGLVSLQSIDGSLSCLFSWKTCRKHIKALLRVQNADSYTVIKYGMVCGSPNSRTTKSLLKWSVYFIHVQTHVIVTSNLYAYMCISFTYIRIRQLVNNDEHCIHYSSNYQSTFLIVFMIDGEVE